MDLTTPQSLTEKEELILRRFKLLQEARSRSLLSWKVVATLVPHLVVGGWLFYQGCEFVSRGQPMLGMVDLGCSALIAMIAVFNCYVLPLQRRLDAIMQLIEDEIRQR